MSKTMKNRRLAFEPRFAYLPDSDRYLTRRGRPEFKVNVIGAGVNGQEHMRVTEYEGRAAVHGIYDPNAGSAQAAEAMMRNIGKEIEVYSDLQAACTDPAVDALIISTPNYTHIDIVETAVKAGKHILLEKPMATTVTDATRILELANASEKIFQIGLQYRYKSIFRESIYEALNRRSLGSIQTISIQEHRISFLDKVGQWNKFSRFSGGTLVEKCCHYFDLFNLFAASKPVRVMASGSQAVNYKDFLHDGKCADILDNAFVIVEYANGVRACFSICMFAPLFYEELVLCGAEGRLKAWERQDFIGKGELECGLELNLGDLAPARYTAPHYPAHIEEAGHHGATFFEHLNFVDNMLGKSTDTATVEDGFWSVVVGAAAEEAVKSGEPIKIDRFLKNWGVNPPEF